MMGPRAWNRRDFNVTPNGYFSVLRPTGWFSTVRLPGGFRYLVGKPKRAVPAKALEIDPQNPTAAGTFVQEQKVADNADGRATEIPLQILKVSERDHGPMRPVLIALAATAIASILLWCIEHP